MPVWGRPRFSYIDASVWVTCSYADAGTLCADERWSYLGQRVHRPVSAPFKEERFAHRRESQPIQWVKIRPSTRVSSHSREDALFAHASKDDPLSTERGTDCYHGDPPDFLRLLWNSESTPYSEEGGLPPLSTSEGGHGATSDPREAKRPPMILMVILGVDNVSQNIVRYQFKLDI